MLGLAGTRYCILAQDMLPLRIERRNSCWIDLIVLGTLAKTTVEAAKQQVSNSITSSSTAGAHLTTKATASSLVAALEVMKVDGHVLASCQDPKGGQFLKAPVTRGSRSAIEESRSLTSQDVKSSASAHVAANIEAACTMPLTQPSSKSAHVTWSAAKGALTVLEITISNTGDREIVHLHILNA